MFVRLTGCNLRCTWCDTAYAFHGGKRMNVNEICHQVDELTGRGDHQHASEAAIQLVELTGGEPLLQEGVYALAQTLLGDGYTVMIETSGERFIGKLPEHVIKIVDVKCPDSGAANTFEYRNLDLLSHNDEVKFVISSRKDYEFAREFTKQAPALRACPPGLVFTGVRRSRRKMERARAEATRRMDPRRRPPRPPRPPTPQIRLAPLHQGV